jgi:uncharacterized protein (DUF305 family)
MDRYTRRFALALFLSCTVQMLARQGSPQRQADDGASWAELGVSMEKMHGDMRAIKPSGNSDVDFVNLMLPHHQAAINMARTELLYGQDPQMRRLAQEIVTDQQSETELMQLWLRRHGLRSQATK